MSGLAGTAYADSCSVCSQVVLPQLHMCSKEISERLSAAEEKLMVLEAKEGIRQAIYRFAQFLDVARQNPKEVITRCENGMR